MVVATAAEREVAATEVGMVEVAMEVEVAMVAWKEAGSKVVAVEAMMAQATSVDHVAGTEGWAESLDWAGASVAVLADTERMAAEAAAWEESTHTLASSTQTAGSVGVGTATSCPLSRPIYTWST